MKKHALVLVVVLLLCLTVTANAAQAAPTDGKVPKRSVVVLDTDVGTDDAVAILIASVLPRVHVDYMIATKGNASLEGATRNAIILKRYLGMDAQVVQGMPPKKDANVTEEKNTFHGNDGLGNTSAHMIAELGLTQKDLSDFMTFDAYSNAILAYDDITYIVIGPLTNLANLLDNPVFGKKLSRLIVMGGGINEFNCSHDTEFNFSKDPGSVKKILESGLEFTLVPLDLTNHQRISEQQIAGLEAMGTYRDYIPLFRFNHKSNRDFNKIDAAVIHDAMPVLYCAMPGKFATETMKLTVDQYGAIKKTEGGHPVRVVMGMENNLLQNTLTGIFAKGAR